MLDDLLEAGTIDDETYRALEALLAEIRCPSQDIDVDWFFRKVPFGAAWSAVVTLPDDMMTLQRLIGDGDDQTTAALKPPQLLHTYNAVKRLREVAERAEITVGRLVHS